MALLGLLISHNSHRQGKLWHWSLAIPLESDCTRVQAAPAAIAG